MVRPRGCPFGFEVAGGYESGRTVNCGPMLKVGRRSVGGGMTRETIQNSATGAGISGCVQGFCRWGLTEGTARRGNHQTVCDVHTIAGDGMLLQYCRGFCRFLGKNFPDTKLGSQAHPGCGPRMPPRPSRVRGAYPDSSWCSRYSLGEQPQARRNASLNRLMELKPDWNATSTIFSSVVASNRCA